MDKIATIKAEIERLKSKLNLDDRHDQGASDYLLAISKFIDSLQKEPVSEDLRDEEETMVYQGEVYTRVYRDELDKFANKFVKSVPKPSRKYARYSDVDMVIAVKEGAKWQKNHIWHDVLEPPTSMGEDIIVLCRNKNIEDGIWLSDLIMYEGKYEPRVNWERPLLWAKVEDILPSKED